MTMLGKGVEIVEMEMKACNKICDYRRQCCIPTPRIDL